MQIYAMLELDTRYDAGNVYAIQCWNWMHDTMLEMYMQYNAGTGCWKCICNTMLELDARYDAVK